MSVSEKTTKLSPNQTDSLNTLDHLIFVSKGCLQNFGSLGNIEVMVEDNEKKWF